MSDSLRGYVQPDWHPDAKWRWWVSAGSRGTLARGRTLTRFGARLAVRRTLKRIRRVRGTQPEEVR